MPNLSVEPTPVQSPAWVFQAKVSFGLALAATVVGVAWMPLDPWIRAFALIAVLYLVTTTFGLAKTLRDVHESGRLLYRVDEARIEHLLSSHDPLGTGAMPPPPPPTQAVYR